jgi:hypothetical protein
LHLPSFFCPWHVSRLKGPNTVSGGAEKRAWEKREMPVNGPGMAQNREKALSGIYTHGRQKNKRKRLFFAIR